MQARSHVRRIRQRPARGLAIRAAAALVLPAMAALQCCSIYMESTRPMPVDLSQFQAGDARESVVERLGTPLSTAGEADGASCDFYNLYTHGYGAAGKAGIAVLEGAADAFTLGLAEILTTPAEGLTRNETHPVTFCYRDAKLARVSESGNEIASFGSAASSDASQATAKDVSGSLAVAHVTPPVATKTDQPPVQDDPARDEPRL